MTHLISVVVQFTCRRHKFRIKPTMDIDEIRCKVGRYFHVDMEKVLLEIYDPHFKLYFHLDNEYLARMRKNVRITENESFLGRIRSFDQSSVYSQYDTNESKELFSETSKIFVLEVSLKVYIIITIFQYSWGKI